MKRNKPGLFYNWQAKILCFLLASCVYVIFFFSGQTKRNVTLPVNVILPDDLAVTSNIPETVDLVITGSEDAIYLIDADNFTLTADFSGVEKTGISAVPVKIDYRDLEEYIDLNTVSISTSPETVRLFFEKK